MSKSKSDVVSSAPVQRLWFERERIFSDISGSSMTHQSHRDAVDVNNIIRQFDRTGSLPSAVRQGVYADVSEMSGDLTERINLAQQTIKTFREERAEKLKIAEAERKARVDADLKELEELRALKASKAQAQSSS